MELLAEARRTFDLIQARPETFPVAHRTARRALLNRFPYAVDFLTTDQATIVVAFLRGHQDRDAALAGSA